MANQHSFQFPTGQPIKRFVDFHPIDNELSLLTKQIDDHRHDRASSSILIHGPSGSGKTHLLCAACDYVFHTSPAMYIDLEGIRLVDVYEDIPLSLDWLMIDNLNRVFSDTAEQEALFHLFNRMTQQDTQLIIATNAFPPQEHFLKDMYTRLQNCIHISTKLLYGDILFNAMSERANQNGLRLTQEGFDWLIAHYSRNPSLLFHFLEVTAVSGGVSQSSFLDKRAVKRLLSNI